MHPTCSYVMSLGFFTLLYMSKSENLKAIGISHLRKEDEIIEKKTTFFRDHTMNSPTNLDKFYQMVSEQKIKNVKA